MISSNLAQQLYNEPVIPAIRSMDDFKYALVNTSAPSLVILFGDINILPELLAEAKSHHKRLILHLDLFEGVGRDRAGITFLSKLGVSAIVTTKTHLGKLAHEQGMLVIQRLFIMDSEAIKTGVKMLHSFKPDAIEILPAIVPKRIVEMIARETGLPVLAGGLIFDESDIKEALQKGISAVSTHEKALWK